LIFISLSKQNKRPRADASATAVFVWEEGVVERGKGEGGGREERWGYLGTTSSVVKC